METPTQTIQGPYKKRKRKNPLIKKVSHRHAYFIILYVMTAVAILFWACVKVVESEAPQGSVLTIQPANAQSPTPATETPVRPSSGSTKAVEVSCYTGIESKGANGRNPWSVATYRYPQGTKLYIEGIGNKVVETVTAKAYSHRIDVWFGETQEDYERCIKFGTQMLEVTAY